MESPTPARRFDVPEKGERWAVIHARPRCEKKLEALCRREGMLTYLPLRGREHVYGGRVRRFAVPLFPGYLFAAGNDAGLRWIRQNQHAANLLETADQAGLVSTLNAIAAALTCGEVSEVFPFVKQGQPVKITDGPLKGVEGIVERWKDRTRVIINVEMIQQSVAIEIEAQHLSPG